MLNINTGMMGLDLGPICGWLFAAGRFFRIGCYEKRTGNTRRGILVEYEWKTWNNIVKYVINEKERNKTKNIFEY